MIVKKFINVILLMGLLVFSVQGRAEEQEIPEGEEEYASIIHVIREVSEVNEQISVSDDEAELRKLIDKKNNLFGRLLLIIRGSIVDPEVESINKEELQILYSKVRINRSKGHVAAAQRDQFKIYYYRTRRDIARFMIFVVQASAQYLPKAEIIKEARSRIKKLSKSIESIEEPLQGESETYNDIEENFQEVMRIYAVYMDFLQYVKDNPDEVIAESFFDKISLIATISYFNNIDEFDAINYTISPLHIDMGGIIVSLVILILTMVTYPTVTKASNRFIEKFILHDGKAENIEFIFVSVHKPILYVVIFFGVDLAMNALLYKTEIQTEVDHFIYIIYQGLFIYLLFNLINSVVAVQFDKADKRNKELSKEFIILIVKTLKGFVFLVSLTLILSHFGINITAILSTLGIGGLAFAMAAKDSLANFFGGINVMVDRIYKMGDWIKVSDVEGTVVEIGLRSTTVRTFDNALITMPNATVSTASVLNWNRRSVGRRIKMHVGVTYESNIDDIRQAVTDIKQMLEDHKGIASPKEKHISHKARNNYLKQEDLHGVKSTQLVFLDRYSDFSIDILVYCFSKTVDWGEWLTVKEDVLFKIADILEKNNLSFAYPTNVQINRNEELEPDNLGGILSE